MNGEVAVFTDEEGGQGSVGDQLTGCSEFGMVNMVGDVCGEQPIIGAVLEQVPQRHGGMRKAVHEDGLQ